VTAVARKAIPAMSNEEIIERFRLWRLQWNPTDRQAQEEIAVISKLAEFIAPLPLSKTTKAVRQDFYLEELMRPQHLRVASAALMDALINFDAFLKDLRAGRW